jgi:hypothetical protein
VVERLAVQANKEAGVPGSTKSPSLREIHRQIALAIQDKTRQQELLADVKQMLIRRNPEICKNAASNGLDPAASEVDRLIHDLFVAISNAQM